MKSFELKVSKNLRIHLRPAGLIVFKMRNYNEDIRIFKGDISANAKKIFEVSALNIKIGDIIRVTVDGDEKDGDFKDIKNYLTSIL